ncbi:MAG: hypothetical protein R3E66_03340 [bacterium]
MWRVLVVTASQAVLSATKRALSDLGVSVTHVSSGALVYGVMDAIRFDAIIYDLALGDGDLAGCWRMQPNAFLIVASDDLVNPLDYGAHYNLLKPLNPTVVTRAMIDAGLSSVLVSEHRQG